MVHCLFLRFGLIMLVCNLSELNVHNSYVKIRFPERTRGVGSFFGSVIRVGSVQFWRLEKCGPPKKKKIFTVQSRLELTNIGSGFKFCLLARDAV